MYKKRQKKTRSFPHPKNPEPLMDHFKLPETCGSCENGIIISEEDSPVKAGMCQCVYNRAEFSDDLEASAKYRTERINRMNLPLRYAKAQLNPEYWNDEDPLGIKRWARDLNGTNARLENEANTPEAMKALEESERSMPPRTLDPNKGILLWGEIGVGKTHLACALALHGVWDWISVRYVDMRTIDMLAWSLSASSSEKERAYFRTVLEALLAYDLLIIDEVGDHDLYYMPEFLDYFINQIYNRRKKVIMITAQHILSKDGLELFAKRVGERSFSQIMGGMLSLVNLPGESKRGR